MKTRMWEAGVHPASEPALAPAMRVSRHMIGLAVADDGSMVPAITTVKPRSWEPT